MVTGVYLDPSQVLLMTILAVGYLGKKASGYMFDRTLKQRLAIPKA